MPTATASTRGALAVIFGLGLLLVPSIEASSYSACVYSHDSVFNLCTDAESRTGRLLADNTTCVTNVIADTGSCDWIVEWWEYTPTLFGMARSYEALDCWIGYRRGQNSAEECRKIQAGRCLDVPGCLNPETGDVLCKIEKINVNRIATVEPNTFEQFACVDNFEDYNFSG